MLMVRVTTAFSSERWAGGTVEQITTLLVKSVEDDDCLVATWNSKNPGKEVRPRDRIVDVNGVMYQPAMMLREVVKFCCSQPGTVLNVKIRPDLPDRKLIMFQILCVVACRYVWKPTSIPNTVFLKRPDLPSRLDPLM